MNRHEYIRSDASVLLGKPVIKGIRQSVEFLPGPMPEGWTGQQDPESYPQLCPQPCGVCSRLPRSARVTNGSTGSAVRPVETAGRLERSPAKRKGPPGSRPRVRLHLPAPRNGLLALQSCSTLCRLSLASASQPSAASISNFRHAAPCATLPTSPEPSCSSWTQMSHRNSCGQRRRGRFRPGSDSVRRSRCS